MSAERARREVNDIVSMESFGPATCLFFETGRIDCWGASRCLQKVITAEPDTDEWGYTEPTPLKPVATDARPVEVAHGGGTACARLDDGRVRCWGCNSSGTVGVARGDETHGYTDVSGLTDVVDIDVEGHYACAIEQSGGVHCWGKLDRLSDAERGGHELRRIGGVDDAESVHVAHDLACVERPDETTLCWGPKVPGADEPVPETEPVEVSVLPAIDDLISTIWVLPDGDRRSVCVRTPDLDFQCQAESPNFSFEPSSLWPRVRDYDEVYESGCVALPNGRVECYGLIYQGLEGVMGQRWERTDYAEPVGVSGLSDIGSVVLGHEHRCALRADGTVFCWGYNDEGQLGNGEVSKGTAKGEVVTPEFQPRTD